MRAARITGRGSSYYHCMSRILERRYLIGSTEKEFFMDTLRRLERFSGVKVLTHCLLDNHFHLFLKVDRPPKTISERELLNRIEALYGEDKAYEIEAEMKRAKKEGHKTWLTEIKQRFLDRMYDLSIFMKELKQRFSQWFNKRNNRRGPLWEDRFKSVLVEGRRQAMLMLASYIDLNPIRAGICEDPKDYRWCGYGAAMGGDKSARSGLQELFAFMTDLPAWRDLSQKYRMQLFGIGTGSSVRKGFDPQKVREVLEADGEVSRFELLRCRIRYFSDGFALGGKRFVEDVFQQNRDRFGPRRQDGGRKMKGMDWEGLFTMRDLRKSVLQAHPP